MATLTPANIRFIRAKSKDNCPDSYIVDDELMQIYYDAAEGDLPTTIVSVLEDRWADAEAGASIVTDFGTRVDTAESDKIKDLLDYWRGRAGIADVGKIGVGTLSLGIDAICDDDA